MITEEKIRDRHNVWHHKFRENAWRPYEAYTSILDYLHVKPRKRYLDFGCGTGYLLKASEQKELETYGIDISS